MSCGILGGALIIELTEVFVSTKSRHVREVTGASGHGGASLNILSGFVAGQFLRLLDGPDDPGADVQRLPVFTKPGSAGPHAGEPSFRRADFCLWPRGLRIPRHGAGDDCRGQLRPGHGQRAVGLQTKPHRIAAGHRRGASNGTSASSPTFRTPNWNSKRATARATRSRPPPSRCSSAPPSWAPPR